MFLNSWLWNTIDWNDKTIDNFHDSKARAGKDMQFYVSNKFVLLNIKVFQMTFKNDSYE